MAHLEAQNRTVLNVGGGSKDIPIPDHYDGWRHLLLDVDSKGGPDIVCDARRLSALESGLCDAVYCAHNLEHYYRHETPKVLAGFHHVLKPDGFAEVRTPDLDEVMKAVGALSLDIEDILYESPAGPITVSDVIYGYGVEIETSGNDFYAHKTGFTPKALQKALHQSGFAYVFTITGNFEVRALAFKAKPNHFHKGLFEFLSQTTPKAFEG